MTVGLKRLCRKRCRASVAQQAAASGSRRRQQQVELGHVDLADAEVGDRVEPAGVGEPSGVGKQPGDLATLGGGPLNDTSEVHDLARDTLHVRPVGEIALTVGAIEVPGVEWDEATDRVKDVDHRCLVALGVPHRVGEHRGQVMTAGEVQGSRGKAGGVGKTTRGRPGQIAHRERGVAGPVAHDLDCEAPTEHRPPWGECRLGEVRAAAGQGAADL